MKDYYQVLGISFGSSESEIRHNYYRLAHQYHPDHHNGTEHKFREIQEAYEVLSDKEKRREYDKHYLTDTDRFAVWMSTLLLNLLNWYNLGDLSDGKRHIDRYCRGFVNRSNNNVEI